MRFAKAFAIITALAVTGCGSPASEESIFDALEEYAKTSPQKTPAIEAVETTPKPVLHCPPGTVKTVVMDAVAPHAQTEQCDPVQPTNSGDSY